MEQTNITLYTLIGKPERVKAALIASFADMTENVIDVDDAHFTIKLKDDSEIAFSINSDQNFMRGHLAGMRNFFAQVPIQCENPQLCESVLQQIQVFNCLAGSTFELDENEDRTNYIVNSMLAAAKEINALVLMPDMRLLSAEGKLVYSSEGKSDYETYTPIANADYLDSRFEESPADIARRARSIAALEKKGIPYLPQLYVAVPEVEAKPRSAEEIVKRLLAMFGVCVYSEVRGGGEKWKGAQKYLCKIDELLGGGLDDALTPNEKAYLAEKKPTQQDLANFSWCYECCHVLLWALGIFEELGWPDKICDVSRMSKLIWNLDSLADLLAKISMRTEEELLDAADLILRCDWACVDARINGREAPAGLDGGVAMEWHRALNWLVGACEDADWDDVTTDT